MKIAFVPMDITRDRSWMELIYPITLTEKAKGIVALDTETNRPVALALFDMWTHTGVCVHWWIDKPMVIRHGFFNEVAQYIFGDCEKTVMVGIIPEENDKSVKLALKLGFEEVGRIKDGYKMGVDQVILEGRVENASKWFTPIAKEEAA